MSEPHPPFVVSRIRVRFAAPVPYLGAQELLANARESDVAIRCFVLSVGARAMPGALVTASLVLTSQGSHVFIRDQQTFNCACHYLPGSRVRNGHCWPSLP